MGAQAGGFLAQPPGLEGAEGLGIAGISGVPRGRTWDAVGSARCPELPGDELTFVAFADGAIVVEADVPDGSLLPLAESLEALVDPPYRAAAVRTQDDVWTAVAESVRLLELPDVDADAIDLTVVSGERELTLDGQRETRAIGELDVIAEQQADVAIHAERVDGNTFAVDVFPL